MTTTIAVEAPYEPTNLDYAVLRDLRAQRNAVVFAWVRRHPLWPGEACLIWRKAYGNPVSVDLPAQIALTRTMAWAGGDPGITLVTWNDERTRTKNDVLALLDATIERVETWGAEA